MKLFYTLHSIGSPRPIPSLRGRFRTNKRLPGTRFVLDAFMFMYVHGRMLTASSRRSKSHYNSMIFFFGSRQRFTKLRTELNISWLRGYFSLFVALCTCRLHPRNLKEVTLQPVAAINENCPNLNLLLLNLWLSVAPYIVV
jgi:hypothetical protein